MSDAQEPVSPQTHRRLAVDCFNKTWELLEKPGRTREDDDAMIHMAHASRHHWGALLGTLGTPTNLARGEWQISRVYATLKHQEASLYHGLRCREICNEHGLEGFDLAYSCEALARAWSLGEGVGDGAERDRWLMAAQEAAHDITEAEDRERLLADLASVPGPDKAE